MLSKRIRWLGLRSWLRLLRSGSRNRSRLYLSGQLRCEALEDRLAPATLTWTGAVDSNWGTAGNWNLADGSHRAPVNGDDLVFPESAADSNFNNVPGLKTINSLTITGAQNPSVGGYTIDPGVLTVGAGGIADLATTTQNTGGQDAIRSNPAVDTVSPSLSFSSAATINVAAANITLGIFNLPLNGPASFTKTGTGILNLNDIKLGSSSSFGGPLVIAAGELDVNDFSLTATSLEVQSGATLGGGGVFFGPVSVDSGGTFLPGGVISSAGFHAQLGVQGSVTLASGSTFVCNTNAPHTGGTPPTTRVFTTGAVTLQPNVTLTLLVPNDFVAPTVAAQTIVTAGDDGLSGTFAGDPDGTVLTQNNQKFRINYTPGDDGTVTLTYLGPAVLPPPSTLTWTGAVDTNWNSARNWNLPDGSHRAPVNGDSLIFPAGAKNENNVNNVAGLTSINSLRFSGNFTGGVNNYTLGGSALAISAGISMPDAQTSGTQVNEIDFPVSLAADQTWSVGDTKANVQLGVATASTLDNQGFNLTLNGPGEITINDKITGAGQLILASSSNVVLDNQSHNSDFSGGVTINSGNLTLEADHNLGAPSAGVIVAGGGTLTIASAPVTPNPLTLNGGTLAGRLLLAGPSFAGPIHLTANSTLANDSGFKFILNSSTIDLGGFQLTTTQPSGGEIDIGDIIQGSGGLKITGAGSTVVLSAANTYTGVTTVNAILVVNGSTAAASAVSVGNGGILGGLGTVVGPITVAAGGSISPGRAPDPSKNLGFLSNTAGVSFSPNSSVVAQLAGKANNPQNDQLNSAGPVALNNATLTLSELAGAGPFNIGQTFPILQAGTPLTTTFQGLSEGSFLSLGGQIFRISYQNDQVTLTVLQPPLTWTGKAGDGLWNTPGNWDLNRVPKNGDNLVFPQSAADSNSNDVPTLHSVNSITFTGPGGASQYQVAPGNITVGAGGITDLSTSAVDQLTAGNTLSFNSKAIPIVVTNSGTSLTLLSTLTGSGSFAKLGKGTLSLFENGSDTVNLGGPVVVAAGTLDEEVTAGATAASLEVQSGATLSGGGTVVGPVTVDSGGTVAPGGMPFGFLSGAIKPDLDVQGAVTLSSGSTFTCMAGVNISSGVGDTSVSATGAVTIQPNVSLALQVLNNFTAPSPATQTILSAGADGLSGTFAGTQDGSILTQHGQKFRINYTPTAVTLTYLGPVASGPLADLQVSNTDNGNTVPGGPITYTVTVTNAGPSAVTGATFTDTFPATLSGVKFTVVQSGGATGAAKGSGSINQKLTLPVNATVTYTVTATISPTATGQLKTTAKATTPRGVTDINANGSSSTDTITLTPQVDLQVTNTDNANGQAVAGTPITYTITVTNTGPSAVTGATITDNFSANLSGVKFTVVQSGGATGATKGQGSINQSLTLPVNAKVTYTVTATVNANATGTLSTTATVTAPNGVTDTDANNSTVQDDVPLVPPIADLSVSLSDSGNGNAVPGRSLTHTLVVSNLSNIPVSGATITDTFPSALHNIIWTTQSSHGSSAPASGRGNLNNIVVNLAANGSVTFTIQGTIDPAARGQLSNTATIGTTAPFTNSNPNNTTRADIDVLNPAADREPFAVALRILTRSAREARAILLAGASG
jgi:uncharacterized repeat protein (TIGR01451 family)